MTGLRIEAPHFVARVEVLDGQVVQAAPIVRYMLGWPETRVRIHAISKRWRVDELREVS